MRPRQPRRGDPASAGPTPAGPPPAEQVPAEQADDAFVRGVYAEHGGALLGYLTRLTGDRAAAEDLMQETVLRAWRHAGKLSGDGRNLRPWLFTVAGRLAIDRNRARAARPREDGSADLDATAPATDDPFDAALQRWQVAEALRSLSAEHRAVLVQTYYRGNSVAEAAHLLGIPPGTVKSRCYYALRALRLALLERGGGS